MADGATNPCKVCHDTAAGTPALRGWAGAGSGPATGWGSKPISGLCYKCHDSSGGTIPGKVGHNMLSNAYADASHSFTIAEAPEEPEGTAQGAGVFPAISSSGLPYTAAAQLECTSCHSVHAAANRPFNQRTGIQELCDECHAGRVANAGSARALAGQTRSYSTHPTRRTLADTARANIKPVAGIAPALKVATPLAPGWTLGGHLNSAAGDDGNIDCQTCHAVHGPAPGTAGLQDLLAIDNTTTDPNPDPSLLCEGCHYGGTAGEQVGSVVLQSALPPGQYSDHPLDGAGNRSFYPTGVAIPALWTAAGTPNHDRGAQPFYTGATKTPVCSSCHDTHGGIGDTPLVRGPQSAGSWGPLTYGVWCFACHATAQVLPGGHHSVIGNLSIALGDAINSQLICGDCHGAVGSTNWTAHNGFWTFAVTVSATDSALCLGCHAADNPADLIFPGPKGQSFAEPAAFPATHGTVRGSSSHYLGTDSDEFPGVVPKVGAWPTSGYFSSYGPPNTGGGGASRRPAPERSSARAATTSSITTARPIPRPTAPRALRGGRATCSWSPTRMTLRASGPGPDPTRSARPCAPAATRRPATTTRSPGTSFRSAACRCGRARAASLTRRARRSAAGQRRGRSRTLPRTRSTATAATVRTGPTTTATSRPPPTAPRHRPTAARRDTFSRSTGRTTGMRTSVSSATGDDRPPLSGSDPGAGDG